MRKENDTSRKLWTALTAKAIILLMAFLPNKTMAQFPAPALALANVPEAANYNLVYTLDVPNNANWDLHSQVPYSVNNAAALTGTPFTRVAYMMDLGTKWVWVSFNQITQNLSEIGIPADYVKKQTVSNMNVFSSAGSGVTDGSGITTGNVEFYPNCYSQAASNFSIPTGNNSLYDFNDDNNFTNDCYGSFQVHNYGLAQTLFAINNWSYNNTPMDLGIGNQVGGHPDWTFATNASSYTIKKIYVLIDNACTAPIITCPAIITVNNDPGQCGANVSFAATATGTSPTITYSQVSGSFFPVGETTVTATATNACGTASCTFTVTVLDSQEPAIICPENISVRNDPGICGAVVNYAVPVGTDNCPGAITTLTAGLPPGSLFPVGTTTVTYTVTKTNNLFYDEFSNNSNGWLLGPEWAIAPTAINNCGNSCTGTSDPQFDHSGSNDNKIAGVVPGGCASTQQHGFYFLTSPAINTNFPGTVMMEYWRHLHSDYPGFAVNIIEVFNGSTWVRLWQEPPSGICFNDLNWTLHGFNITAYKNANFRVRYGFNITSGGVYIMPSWSIDDFRIYSSGTGTQSASCSFTVTVTDNQNPTISCPAPISVNTNPGICGATVNYTVTSADNCPGQVVTQTAGLASGSVFPVGITTNIFLVTDASGNTATCSFTVTVTDNEAPVITAPNLEVCYEDGNYGCALNLGATATDNCPPASLTSNAPGCFPVGTTTVIWTAVDNSGNSSTVTQTVRRNPEIHVTVCASPTATIYTEVGPQCVSLSATASGGTPGYTYNWAASPGLSSTNGPNAVVCPTTTTSYTVTVTDDKGCTRSLSFTVTVLPMSAAVCSGSGNNIKFNVCHVPPGNPANPQNICISQSALNAHLTSGSNGHNNCYLGPCGQQLCFSTTPGGASFVRLNTEGGEGKQAPIVETKQEFSVNVYPNPSRDAFRLYVSGNSDEPVQVRVIDANGVIRGSSVHHSKEGAIMIGSNLRSGFYMAEIIQGQNRKVIKLVKVE